MRRRWVLLGFNLLLATAILAQPGEAASACDFNQCTCDCLEVWDECYVPNEDVSPCDRKYNKCMKKTKCKPEIIQ